MHCYANAILSHKKTQGLPLVIATPVLDIRMGENNFSTSCVLLIIEKHIFFPLLILSVFCDLIGCPFYFSSHLSGQWRRDRLSLNMQNAGKAKLVSRQSMPWNILNIRIIPHFNDKDFYLEQK